MTTRRPKPTSCRNTRTYPTTTSIRLAAARRRRSGPDWARFARACFATSEGFDERFRRPSVEDIELGYRVRRFGWRLQLAPEFRGCHLKRWTLWGSIVTDISARGIPWAQLIRKFQAFNNDLNTRTELRMSVVLAYLFLFFARAVRDSLGGAGRGREPVRDGVAELFVLPLVRPDARNLVCAARLSRHVLHHVCNGVSFVVGTGLFAGESLRPECARRHFSRNLAAASCDQPRCDLIGRPLCLTCRRERHFS